MTTDQNISAKGIRLSEIKYWYPWNKNHGIGRNNIRTEGIRTQFRTFRTKHRYKKNSLMLIFIVDLHCIHESKKKSKVSTLAEVEYSSVCKVTTSATSIVLFCFILFYFILFYFILFYFILFYFIFY